MRPPHYFISFQRCLISNSADWNLISALCVLFFSTVPCDSEVCVCMFFHIGCFLYGSVCSSFGWVLFPAAGNNTQPKNWEHIILNDKCISIDVEKLRAGNRFELAGSGSELVGMRSEQKAFLCYENRVFLSGQKCLYVWNLVCVFVFAGRYSFHIGVNCDFHLFLFSLCSCSCLVISLFFSCQWRYYIVSCFFFSAG